MLLLESLMFPIIYGICYCNPIVNLPNGKIQGIVTITSRYNVTFNAFLGIPFAAPPIGKFRFQPPQPVENWNGILETSSNTKICYQVQREDVNAGEDCLYLNVYTPVLSQTGTALPVLVFFHGGAFIHGSAWSGYSQPQYILEKGILVVTSNYRLGPFGFLSTGDAVIPGNMGLKDQQFALKWIQKNIHLFGGDPKKVTISGQSAGAASVTYQILSPGSSGLFRAALAQSGSALCIWAHQRNAVDVAYGIAARINPNFGRNNTSEELLRFLQSVDARSIVNTGDGYDSFAPVIEIEHKGAMITKPMYESVKNGNINKVPLLIGITSEEEITLAGDLVAWKTRVEKYDVNLKVLVNGDMNIKDAGKVLEIGEKVRKIYTDGLLQDNLGAAIQYYSDNQFTRAIIKYAELQSKYTDVYFYQFSHDGPMGNQKVSMKGLGKVAHAEDLKYFWKYYDNFSKFPELDVLTLDRNLGMLTNFVKYLNPTPEKTELFQYLQWPKVTPEKFHYMDIDDNLKIRENPRNFSYNKWVELYKNYGSEPFVSF